GLFTGQEVNEEAVLEEEVSPLPTPEISDNILNTIQDYHKIEGEAAIKELVGFLALQDEFCFDTETNSVNPNEAELVGMSFAYVEGEAFYVPVPADQEQARGILEYFREVFENENITKIGQNIKFDLLVLKNHGMEIRGKLFDTMLAHYLIAPEGKHSMDW